MTDTMPQPRYSIWQALAAALHTSMRALEEVRALARDGGKPGPPGLGFDDLIIDFDGERRMTLRFERGEQKIEKTLTLQSMIYRNVFVEGRSYEKGDVVTWGGSLWHCDNPSSERPKGSGDWTLCVKAGRDGRDGRDGAKGEIGPEGKAGRDWTELGPRGERQ
jgi:hypothetical protein